MKKKQNCLSNSRLFITEDIFNPDVWYARTDTDLIARIKLKDKWEVYFYPFKILQYKDTLTESLAIIEFMFKKFWWEKYGGNK